MKEKDIGYLVISLDFELLWGVCHHETANSFNTQIRGARESIPKLLDLFESYDIHATWGVVGMLMAENKTDMMQYIPIKVPQYQNEKLSAYNHMCAIGNNEDEDIFHYANSLVSKILKYKNQEIASHTFSHYHCGAEGETLDSFREDLLAAKKIAKEKFSVDLHSLIFPRNRFTTDHIRIAKECDFTVYRGNPQIDAYNRGRLIDRLVRLIDTYIGICGRKSYKLQDCKDLGIVNVRASSFFRKYNIHLSVLEPTKIHQIKSEMLRAARNGEIFHLWWHPHNIGNNLDKCLKQIEELLIYYTELREQYGFSSKNMNEIAELIIE